MQTPAWLSGFVRWRWMPSVALVSGSLAFVAITVLVVPEDFESVAGTTKASSRTRSRLVENAGATKESNFELPSLRSFLPGRSDEEPSSTRQAALPVADEKNVVQSIFHSAPTVELPVAPPDPDPEPPPATPPPPPPPPIFTLPSPPEQQPAALPPAAVPPQAPALAAPAPAGITPPMPTSQ